MLPPDEPSPSSPPLRLCNVFTGAYPEGTTLWPKCYYTLPPTIHDYFFRKLFASRRGIYQELTSAFYAKLFAECQARGLVGQRAIWDKDNERIVAEILRDLNFNDLTNELNTLRDENATLRAQLRPKISKSKRGAGVGRTTKGSDVPPGQP